MIPLFSTQWGLEIKQWYRISTLYWLIPKGPGIRILIGTEKVGSVHPSLIVDEKISFNALAHFLCVCVCVSYWPVPSEQAAALSSTVRHFLVSQSQSLELLASRPPPHLHNYVPTHTHTDNNIIRCGLTSWSSQYVVQFMCKQVITVL